MDFLPHRSQSPWSPRNSCVIPGISKWFPSWPLEKTQKPQLWRGAPTFSPFVCFGNPNMRCCLHKVWRRCFSLEFFKVHLLRYYQFSFFCSFPSWPNWLSRTQYLWNAQYTVLPGRFIPALPFHTEKACFLMAWWHSQPHYRLNKVKTEIRFQICTKMMTSEWPCFPSHSSPLVPKLSVKNSVPIKVTGNVLLGLGT